VAPSIHLQTLDLSRRRLIAAAALITGTGAALAAGLTATPAAAAAAAVSQKVAKYQSTPKGAQQCDNCLQWQPPSSCKVVEGSIDPAAWCALYGPNPKS